MLRRFQRSIGASVILLNLPCTAPAVVPCMPVLRMLKSTAQAKPKRRSKTASNSSSIAVVGEKAKRTKHKAAKRSPKKNTDLTTEEQKRTDAAENHPAVLKIPYYNDRGTKLGELRRKAKDGPCKVYVLRDAIRESEHVRSPHITFFRAIKNEKGVIVPEDKLIETENILPDSPEGFVFKVPFASSALSIAEAAQMIDLANMRSFALTLTVIPFEGRAEVMTDVETKIARIQDPVKRARVNGGKGLPIIGTGAMTGVGKSRLLEEIRLHYKKLGYVVIVISYNSGAGLLPSTDETDSSNITKVEKGFLSRLLCMMLPESEFLKVRELHAHFDVTFAEVVQLMADVCRGKHVLVLMDEVVSLGVHNADHAMNHVISLLGKLCQAVTANLERGLVKTACVAIFTALSQKIIDDAKTVSERGIHSIQLPLLSRDAVEAIVRHKVPNVTQEVLDDLFAITAGHARTLVDGLLDDLQWNDQRIIQGGTLDDIMKNITNYMVVPSISEAEVRAVLLEDPTKADFDVLFRRSMVHKDPESGKVVMVPAFLFKWATETKATSTLASHVYKCLESAWTHIIFQSGKKKDRTDTTFENFMRHFESVRRDLLHEATNNVTKQPMLVEDFYRTESPEGLEWASNNYFFPPITRVRELSQPSKNKWSNFDVTQINSTTCRYQPEAQNFPLYDSFTFLEEGPTAREGGPKNVPKGEQMKHGTGNVPRAAPGIVSVKLTTSIGGLDEWKEKGWLTLDGDAIRKYLGSTMSAAGSSALLLPEKS